jgi:large subunit ribosomal protein L30
MPSKSKILPGDGDQPSENPLAGNRTLRVTYAVSSIGVKKDQKDTVLRLGLKRLGQTVDQPDSPSIRGMIHKVRHLLTVEEVDE